MRDATRTGRRPLDGCTRLQEAVREIGALRDRLRAELTPEELEEAGEIGLIAFERLAELGIWRGSDRCRFP